MTTSDTPPAGPAMIDERVARAVAATTVLLAAVVLATGWWVVLAPLAADFAARAAGRPRWSLLGRLARNLVVTRLRGAPRPVAAAPKRFAAGIGTVVSGTALLAAALGAAGVAAGLLGALIAAAFLEAAFGFCIGCRVHARLAAAGLVADDCPECRDLSGRVAARD